MRIFEKKSPGNCCHRGRLFRRPVSIFLLCAFFFLCFPRRWRRGGAAALGSSSGRWRTTCAARFVPSTRAKTRRSREKWEAVTTVCVGGGKPRREASGARRRKGTKHSRCGRFKCPKEDPSDTVMRQPRWAQIDDSRSSGTGTSQ